MKKIILILAMSLSLWANNVYVKVVNAPMEGVYDSLLESFADNSLIVVAQIDILKKFHAAGLPKKLGKDFNTNNLTGIRSIIACNGGLANAIANADPTMMSFCPIRVTLVEQEGKTTITYVKATSAPKDSKAYTPLKKLEEKVIKSIDIDYSN
ncbi:MAG: DUF302 domain-containing protein [Thiovulaceae bacterium]|nr:DUF302 domain-containing protein [Sulfurimonadaceae bacterium]